MTREETAKLLTMVKINFKSSFRDLTNEEKNLIVDQWCMNFRTFSWETVLTAFNDYMKNNTLDYTPQVGQIFSGVMQILQKRMPLPQAPFEDVWQNILKAARYDPRQAKAEFAKLPENIQKALGGYSRLVEIGRAYEEDLKWIKKSVQKEYGDVLAEEKLMYLDGRLSLETVQKQNTLPMYKGDRINPELGIDMTKFQMK